MQTLCLLCLFTVSVAFDPNDDFRVSRTKFEPNQTATMVGEATATVHHFVGDDSDVAKLLTDDLDHIKDQGDIEILVAQMALLLFFGGANETDRIVSTLISTSVSTREAAPLTAPEILKNGKIPSSDPIIGGGQSPRLKLWLWVNNFE